MAGSICESSPPYGDGGPRASLSLGNSVGRPRCASNRVISRSSVIIAMGTISAAQEPLDFMMLSFHGRDIRAALDQGRSDAEAFLSRPGDYPQS